MIQVVQDLLSKVATMVIVFLILLEATPLWLRHNIVMMLPMATTEVALEGVMDTTTQRNYTFMVMVLDPLNTVTLLQR